MRFLFRVAFWVTILVILIPVPEDARPGFEPASASEALGVAQAAMADAGGFCDRNEGICETAGRVVTTFALKLQAGAEWVYDFVDRQLGGGDEPDSDAVATSEDVPAAG